MWRPPERIRYLPRPGAIVVEATGIRDEASGPLLRLGKVLAGAQADIVGFARRALADPDWFRNDAAGPGANVRLCVYTNYCEVLDQRHRQVTCKRRLTPPAWTPPP